MKEYIETFTNPRTNQVEDITVYEYSFEDWQNGKINTNFSAGKRLTFNIDKQAFEYNYLPINEKQNIIEKAKEIYNSKVEAETNLFKAIINKRLSLSQAKEKLLESEIEAYKKLLSNDLLPIRMLSNIERPLELILPSGNMPFPILHPDKNEFIGVQNVQNYSPTTLDTIQIDSIRKMYKKIIVEGIKDYTLTNSPNFRISIGGGDSHYIRVEAIHNYIAYLNELNIDIKVKVKMTAKETEIFTPEQFKIFDFLNHNYNTTRNTNLQKFKIIFQYLRSSKGLHYSKKDKYIDYVNEKYLSNESNKLKQFKDIENFNLYTIEIDKKIKEYTE